MEVEKKDLPKSQVELNIELSLDEFKPYISQGAEKVSREIKIKKNVKGEPVGQPQVEITKLAPDNPMRYKITIALLPKLELGNYKDLKIKEEQIEIKDEEVERTINDLRESRAKEAAADREIKEGDKAIVDIQMYLDKVPIEGGQNKDTAILVGKNYIIAGFDKKILGAKKGDTRDFELPYPKDHHMQNLAGKMVEFKVTIKEIYSRELPKLNDDFALSLGLKKMSELKDNIKQSLKNQKQKDASLDAERKMLDKILEKTKFGDIPEMLVNSEVKTMLSELEQTIEGQGGKFSDYLSSLNKTRDQLTLDLLPDALKRVKVSLLIREIGNKEKITVTEEEANKYLQELKNHYKDNKELSEQMNSPAYKNYVANVLTSRKIVDQLRKWNIV